MKLNLSALVAALAVSTLACSAESQDDSNDAPATGPVRYVIDPAHTHVLISIQRFGFNDIFVDFKNVTGEILLDQAEPANSRATASIEIASVYSGDDTRDEHLQGPFWFNAEAFPTVEFSTTSVETTSETTAVLSGDLTILGQSRPITLEVALNKIGVDPGTRKEAAGFSATAHASRAALGLETAPGMIGDDVDIRIEVLAHRSDG